MNELILLILLFIIILLATKIIIDHKKLSSLIDENKELISKNSSNQEIINNCKTETEKLENENNSLKETLKKVKQTKNKLENENNILKKELELTHKNYEDKINSLKISENSLKTEFENLANKILEQSSEKLSTLNQQNLLNILSPFKQEIQTFKEKIENISKNEIILKNELDNIKELNFKLSKNAEKLSNALISQSKTQGVWGEFILDKILQNAGLEEGIEYKKEVTLKNETKTYRPDVIVYLPNNKEIIIDAKTSLKDYIEYINTNNEEYLKKHIESIKKHIKTLSEKNYEKLEGINSLEFILMFIPIENALNVAIKNEPSLFDFALSKNIILVNPTTLLIALKTIEQNWKYEKQNKNMQEIIKLAERLYDKMRGFFEDLENIGKSLEKTKDSYDKAINKFSEGRGNILKTLSEFKKYANIKPKKDLPNKFKEE